MKEFAVTFGQQYPREPHPKVGYAHRDGWLTIEADTEPDARQKAFDELGVWWAFLYEMDKFDRSYFPLGELHRI